MYWKAPKEKKQLTNYDLKELADRFLDADSLKGLAGLLRMKVDNLKSIAFKPQYRQFYIPKPNGKKRLIETPSAKLMQIQKRLAFHLQAVYRGKLPACSYGFILSTADDEEPRDIYTNAQRHIGQEWVFGLDLKDFFHAIPTDRIVTMLRKPPFHFTKNASRCIAQLSTFKGRLPMGAATSPVLSNLICLWLDHDLEKLAEEKAWVYTRFADDMTFSGKERFSEKDQGLIRDILHQNRFTINEKKVRQQSISEFPEITGLILKDGKPDTSPGYVKTLKQDIDLFHDLTTDRILERGIFPSKAIELFRRSIKGQIQFVGFVKGEDHKTFIKLKHRLAPPKRRK
jgi:RNA-directed DNA polymerase